MNTFFKIYKTSCYTFIVFVKRLLLYCNTFISIFLIKNNSCPLGPVGNPFFLFKLPSKKIFGEIKGFFEICFIFFFFLSNLFLLFQKCLNTSFLPLHLPRRSIVSVTYRYPRTNFNPNHVNRP